MLAVRVRMIGERTSAADSDLEVQMQEGATVADLLSQLGISAQITHLISRNSHPVPLSAQLHDGDAVSIYPLPLTPGQS